MSDYNLGEARGKIILETDLTSLTDAQKQLDGFKNSSNNSAQQQQQSWNKVANTSLVAGAAIAAGFAVAVNSASDFEFQMSAIQAVSGATKSEMDSISDAALRIGKDTVFSASEAANAMEELIKAGISVDDVLNGAADAAVALAAAGGVDIPTAATLAANAMNQFNLKAEDMAHVADQIAGAANASAIDVNEFGESLSQVGAVANLVGLSFDDTALAIAAMGNAGIKGSDAGTSLKQMLMRLNPSTKEASDLMSELGIITEDGSNRFYDAEGHIKSLADISDVLSGALAGMTDQQKQAALATLFGSDAIRGAAIIADTGKEGFDALAESIGGISAADVAAARMDNLKGSTEQLMGSLETLWISIGQKLIPVIKTFVDWLTEVVNWFTAIPDWVQGVLIALGLLGGGLLLLAGSFIKIIGFVQAFKEALVIATGAQEGLNLAMKANIIGVIIAAIMALVGALIWFFTQTELGKEIWSNFVGFLQEAWANIQRAIQPVVDWFVNTAWPAIQDAAGKIGEVFQTLYENTVTQWRRIKQEVQPVVDWFNKYVIEQWNEFVKQAEAIWKWLTDTIFPMVAEKMQPLIDKAVELGNKISEAWQKIVDAVGPLVEQILGYIQRFQDKQAELSGDSSGGGLEKTASDFETAAGAIGFFVDRIVGFTTDIMNAIGWIVGFISGIIAGIIGIVTGIIGFVNSAYDWINQTNDNLHSFVDSVTQFVSEVVSNIIGFFVGLWQGFMSFIQPFIDFWNQYVQPVFDAFGAMVSKIFGYVWSVIQWVLGQIAQYFQDVWNGIVGFFTPILDTIFGAVNDAFTKVSNFISDIWNGIVNFIRPILDAIFGSINRSFTNVVNFIHDIFSPIVEWFAGIFQGASDSVKEKIDGIVSFVTGIKDTVVGFFANAGEWLKDAGENIINGLIDGIKGALGGLKDLFTGITNDIPEQKGPPEKDKVLLYDNGKLIMQSLVNGLQSQMGDVKDLMNGLNATIPASLNQSLTASVDGGSGLRPVQINVDWHAADNDQISTKEQVMEMLGHATELVREELV